MLAIIVTFAQLLLLTLISSTHAHSLIVDAAGVHKQQMEDVAAGRPRPSPTYVDSPADRIMDVDSYGAVADGSTDDTLALAHAWRDVCSAAVPSVQLRIPAGKAYLVNTLEFAGPCAAAAVAVQLAGALVAPLDPADWNRTSTNAWIQFKDVSNLSIHGGGHLNGRGQLWWAQSCKRNKTNKCSTAPTALKFSNVKGLEVVGIASVNSPQMHIILSRCSGVRMVNVKVVAPANSPNTDGIHVSASQHVIIQDSSIATGDDCISIVNHSDDILATNITCGPGHGISIGSLGKGGFRDNVARVAVDGAKLVGTTNGLRIKTWRDGSGSAADFRFENVVMENVSFPIIIDQNYCDMPNKCPVTERSAVRVSNVLYRNIRGTSATKQGIKLACSSVAPCTGLHFENINLRLFQSSDAKKEPSKAAAAAVQSSSADTSITSYCHSAQGIATGTVVPTLESCLEPPSSEIKMDRMLL